MEWLHGERDIGPGLHNNNGGMPVFIHFCCVERPPVRRILICGGKRWLRLQRHGDGSRVALDIVQDHSRRFIIHVIIIAPYIPRNIAYTIRSLSH